MTKVMKNGMPFEENNIPDFGSIDRGEDGHLYLVAEDIPKLNTTCTVAGCTPFLGSSEDFAFRTGDTAFVVDWLTAETGSMYIYHGVRDQWYELTPFE